MWRIHRDVFLYSASLLGEIAEGDVSRIDEAMRWGFNWDYGPFELWQGLGLEKIRSKLKKEVSADIYPAWLDRSKPSTDQIWMILGASFLEKDPFLI